MISSAGRDSKIAEVVDQDVDVRQNLQDLVGALHHVGHRRHDVTAGLGRRLLDPFMRCGRVPPTGRRREARPVAMARPMPCVEPVTSAVTAGQIDVQ